ncbi:MAG: helix-turn-helix domain-containing protein [Acidobacteriota bacterium]
MAQAAAKLLTLTEVAKRTNISMPTLQRYKKLYQDRIPSEGAGRKQRYPQEALDIFLELKKENIGRRGRPRKNAAPAKAAPARKAKKTAKKPKAAKRGRKPAARTKKAAASSTDELLTLTQVSKLTGVSYPTLLRYVKTNLNDIPHKGEGRARRFKPEAVSVFKSLRQRSKRGRKSKAALAAAGAKPAAKAATSRKTASKRRGRPPKVVDTADLLARIKDLEKSHKQLERLIAKQQKQIDKPYRVVLKR